MLSYAETIQPAMSAVRCPILSSCLCPYSLFFNQPIFLSYPLLLQVSVRHLAVGIKCNPSEMERKLRSRTIRPLPEERQGTSGAGAGRRSVRTTSGRRLNRWTSTGEPEETTPNTTHQRSSPEREETTHDTTHQELSSQERQEPVNQVPLAPSVSTASQPLTTKAGKPRQRMKWTSLMNETILRVYYQVTNLGQITVGYRQQLHAEFCKVYPELQVTEQRIADQYRTILRNNLIPEGRRNEIMQQVEEEINHHATGTVEPETEEETPINTSAIGEEGESADINPEQNTEANAETQDDNNETIEKLTTEMTKAMMEYNRTDPLSRPVLPRLRSSRKLGLLLNIMNNRIISDYLLEVHTLEDLHTVLYCAATAITRIVGVKILSRAESNIRKKQREMPNWERRLNNKIDNLRKDIGHLTEYQNGIRTTKIKKSAERIMARTQQHSRHEPLNSNSQQCLDTLKQKLSLYSGRLRRYKNSNNRKQDNKLFENNEKEFYRRLNQCRDEQPTEYPTKQQVDNFWRGQLSSPVPCNINANWIKETQNSQDYDQMQFQPYTTEEVGRIISQLHNWKAPGPDGLHNYWIKKLSRTHQQLTILINDVLQDPEKMPPFLTQGSTMLIPKDQENTQDPTKYRPITCLPTLYKVITSCITHRIYDHCEKNQIIAEQQKGCIKEAMGCKELLIVDSVISNQAFKQSRNLHTAYIDYKKAFDSVPHEWLIKILKLYKIDDRLVGFLSHIMPMWKTKICLQTNSAERIETSTIPIRRGIFQGDSLSSLWFCLAMNPLSCRLNSTKYGFGIRKNNTEIMKLNHLLYMDDVKLMASSKDQLEKLLKVVEEFSRDVGMEFGLDKCRTLHIQRGKIQPGSFTMEDGQTIKSMEAGETYKYLGMKQARKLDHSTMKKEFTQEFVSRLRKILKTKLNSKNLTKAINTYACTALTYSFGVVKWTKTDIENLQRKMRTLLTKAQKHHPKSAVERTTLPRSLGGRGLIDIGRQLDQQIENLRKYFYRKAETSALHKAVCEVDTDTPLQLRNQDLVLQGQSDQEKLQRWTEKALHGRHPNEVNQDYVDKQASNYWLTSGQMFPETEGFLMAIQDQVIPTRNYQKHIIGDQSITNDFCRYGCQTAETIQHVTGGCQAFAANEYKERHDGAAKILHQELAMKLGLIQGKRLPYYQYTPETILEDNQHKLIWDRTLLTDQYVAHNRPDITIVNKNSKEAILIDIAIPNNNNIRSKHNEKIAKYRDLEVRIKTQWKLRSTRIVPIVISTTGTIPKDLLHNLRDLGLNENLYKPMQKAVLLSTARSVKKFLGSSATTDR